MTSGKIMERIDANINLQSIFAETDPNIIATTLDRELNSIAEDLITKTRIQNKKDSKNHDDEELRYAREEIRKRSRIVHNTRDADKSR